MAEKLPGGLRPEKGLEAFAKCRPSQKWMTPKNDNISTLLVDDDCMQHYSAPRIIQATRDIRIDEGLASPQIQAGQVLVDIEWCGICGSDLHEYLTGPNVIPTEERPHPLTGEHLPVIMGHEFCGKISQVGENTKFSIGQSVMVDPRMFCKSCHRCVSAQTNICAQWAFKGLHGQGGGFSEAIAVDENMCYALPDSIPLAHATLIEPLVVGRHALKSSGFTSFENVSILILGGGPVGLAVATNLRARGAKRISVSEPAKKRKMQMIGLADEVFDPFQVSIGNECRKLTKDGVDLVFDCAGIPAGLKDGMDALRSRGTYVNVAGWEKPFVVPMEFFMMKELNLRVSMSYTSEDFQEVVEEFIAGKFEGVESFITGRISLDDIVSKGFEELINNKDDHVKILVTPKSACLVDA